MSAVESMPPAKTQGAGLQCRGVGKRFNPDSEDEVCALQDIDLDIAPGEFVVMIGPSGCGKSTLLYVLAGLLGHDEGTVSSDGEALGGPGPDRCLIFQETSLFPWLTVADNVTFGLRLRGVDKARRREAAGRLLRQVGLGDVLDKRPDELSGGMRQRAAIARALAMEPRALLMDEPFAALDVQTRSRLQDFLISVWQESGASVAFVTHHIDEAIALADRIVVFTARPGKIKAIVPVTLARPRDPRDPAFHDLADRLIDLLGEEVDRAFAEQEAGGA